MNVWDELMFRKLKNHTSDSISYFLSRLTPGTKITLQYSNQPPAIGVFQGFEDGNVILTNFNDFPGLVRIVPSSIHAISISE